MTKKIVIWLGGRRLASASIKGALLGTDDIEKIEQFNGEDSFLNVRERALLNGKANYLTEDRRIEYGRYWHDRKDMVSFIVVRNPLDKFMSGMRYLQRSGQINPNVDLYDSFLRATLNPTPEQKNLLLRTQTKGLVKNGAFIPDYVVRFENLEEDLVRVFKEIDLPLGKIPHLNKGNLKNYRESYSDRLYNKVLKIFRPDFEYLGYSKEL